MVRLLVAGLIGFLLGAACEKLFAHRIYEEAVRELHAAKDALRHAIDRKLE